MRNVINITILISLLASSASAGEAERGVVKEVARALDAKPAVVERDYERRGFTCLPPTMDQSVRCIHEASEPGNAVIFMANGAPRIVGSAITFENAAACPRLLLGIVANRGKPEAITEDNTSLWRFPGNRILGLGIAEGMCTVAIVSQ